jgi:hypothetical protein
MESGMIYDLCLSTGIEGMGTTAMVSLASETVTELVDETTLTSKFWMSGGEGGEEKEGVEWEQEGYQVWAGWSMR